MSKDIPTMKLDGSHLEPGRRRRKLIRDRVKPGSHMPPTYLDVAAGMAWDNAAAYVNTYRRHIICRRH